MNDYGKIAFMALAALGAIYFLTRKRRATS
jgi:hypothetical protein